MVSHSTAGRKGAAPLLSAWRARGRPSWVPQIVWSAAREVSSFRDDQRVLRSYLDRGAEDPDDAAITWAGRVAAQRARTARLTQHSALGSSREDLERFTALFHVTDAGIPLVRMGPGGDGSYLLPDDLEDVVACFSPGVSDSASFEEALAERGIRSFMADGSVSSPPSANDLFDFEPVFLGVTSRPGWTTLGDWVDRKAPAGDLMLQMDIEGAEWTVLAQADADLLRRFRIIVLELHGLHALHQRFTLPAVEDVWRKVLDDFVVVHLHVNNHEFPFTYWGMEIPPALEVTLLRRDRVVSEDATAVLPHPLDVPNSRHMPDFAVPTAWYRS